MDAAVVRKEIKSWEHTFKDKNNRNPTVDDIKKYPDIAAKYKLYKTLSKKIGKSENKHNAETSSQLPQVREIQPGVVPVHIVPKSRAIPSLDDIPTSNPFSPTKSPAKKDSSGNLFSDMHIVSVRDVKERHSPMRKTPSPEPFPLIELTKVQSQEEDGASSFQTVKKARKRLRGDAVSPSPCRVDKKRRTASFTVVRDEESQTTQLFSNASDISSEDEIGSTSYIDESPVKSTSNGKHFKLLFDDEYQNGAKQRRMEQRISSPQLLFKSPDKMTAKPQPTSPVHSFDRKDIEEVNEAKGNDKQNFTTIGADLTNEIKEVGGSEYIILSRASRKRDTPELDRVNPINGQEYLLPPSPPPLDTSYNYSQTIQRTTKNATRARKKIKPLIKDQEGFSSGDDDENVRLIEGDLLLRRPNLPRSAKSKDNDDLDFYSGGSSGLGSSLYGREILEEDSSDGELEVDLPDGLRKVLHISTSRTHDREERALVESLLQGRPNTDGMRGEVWGIGEVEEPAHFATDGEDEWADEGIPWAIGEL